MGVHLWITKQPPPSFPPLKGEGGDDPDVQVGYNHQAAMNSFQRRTM